MRHVIWLTGLSFAAHLAWELAQCSLLYVHDGYAVGVGGMLLATLGDVFLTWTIFAIVAATARCWRWDARTWRALEWSAVLAMSAVLAVIVEWRGLGRGAWTYLPQMPTLPLLGVGVVPVIQLVLLTPLLFRLAAKWAPPGITDETRLIQQRYDRIAPVYDAMEWVFERFARKWRADLWAALPDQCVLELGIGTGKNLRYHAGRRVIGLDISPRMLARAARRQRATAAKASLVLGDAQKLPFASDSFDTVVATFLFCSVPDPVTALAEARRVLRPGGTLVLLEHVLSKKWGLRRLMRWFDPVTVRISGAHIARDTASNVTAAGFDIAVNDALWLDIVRLIRASPQPLASSPAIAEISSRREDTRT